MTSVFTASGVSPLFTASFCSQSGCLEGDRHKAHGVSGRSQHLAQRVCSLFTWVEVGGPFVTSQGAGFQCDGQSGDAG